MELLQTSYPKDSKMREPPMFGGVTRVPPAFPAPLSQVFSFFRESIPFFVDHLGGKAVNLSETTITDTLVDFLQRRLRATTSADEYPYCFHHEASETNSGNSARNDFAVFALGSNGIVRPTLPEDRIAIARFEAKRLVKLDRSREKEYVLGEYHESERSKNSGGIERFKNGTHGKPREHNAALVAYIQTDDTSTWFPKINYWIDEEIADSSDPNLTWDTQDKLSNRQTYSHHDEFNSTSARLNSAEINLQHFWIPLNKIPSQNL